MTDDPLAEAATVPTTGRGPRRNSTVRGTVLGLKVLAATVSALVVVGSGYAWATYRNLTTNISRIQITTHSSADAKNIDGSAQNILIVGNDDRQSASPAELAMLGTTADGGSLNTDTMMLLHVPADGRKATIISFPRDSYVSIPGHGKAKLNSAYTTGLSDSNGDKNAGASLLTETIEDLTGLKIDHFVQVDLLGFYRISNAIGGVDLCLNEDARPARYSGERGDGIDSGYENGTFVPSYTQINLHKGINKDVSGLQALAFVRQRHGLPGGDLDRVARQRYFLSQVFTKLSSAGTLTNPFKLQSLVGALRRSLTLDQTLDPIKLAAQMQGLNPANLTLKTIPLSGDQTIDGVGDVEVVNFAAMPGFIADVIGIAPPASYAGAAAAKPASVHVTVFNDTSTDGLAASNAQALRALGFVVSVPAATSDVIDTTTIEYPKGSEAAAKAVQQAVPGAVVTQSSTVSSVTLLLGNNDIQVRTLMPKTSPSQSARPTRAPASQSAAAPPNCVS